MKKLKVSPKGLILVFIANIGRTALAHDWIDLTPENIRVTEIGANNYEAQIKTKIGYFTVTYFKGKYDSTIENYQIINQKHWGQLFDAVQKSDFFKALEVVCKSLDENSLIVCQKPFNKTFNVLCTE